MIKIQELSKNLPINMTKVVIDFTEIIRESDRDLYQQIVFRPVAFVTRIYNVDVMINYRTGHHSTRYYVSLGKCREKYYMEDHDDFLHNPETFQSYEVNEEDYNQFAAFRENPVAYLKHYENAPRTISHRKIVNPIMELEI